MNKRFIQMKSDLSVGFYRLRARGLISSYLPPYPRGTNGVKGGLNFFSISERKELDTKSGLNTPFF
jgi:hypothetical protein